MQKQGFVKVTKLSEFISMGISYLKVGTRIRSAVCESQDLLNFGFNYGTLVYGVGSYGAIGLGIVTGPAPDRSFRPSPRLSFRPSPR